MAQPHLSDLKFHKTAPAELRKAARSGDAAVFQKKLTRQWADFSDGFFSGLNDHRFACTVGISEILQPADGSVFDLAVGAFQAGPSAARKKIVAALIDEISAMAGEGKLSTEFSLLLAMELLVRFGDRFLPEPFADTVLAVTRFQLESLDTDEASSTVSNVFSEEEQNEESKQQGRQLLLRSLIRFAEIPFLRSLLFDFLVESKKERTAARATLAEALEASCETDGTVQSRLAMKPAGWLSPCIRMGSAAAARKVSWAKSATTEKWISALEFFAALTVRGGWLIELPAAGSMPPESDRDESEFNPATANSDLLPEHFLNAALLNLQAEDKLLVTGKSKSSGKGGKKRKPSLLKESSLPDVVASLKNMKSKARKKPGPEMEWYTPSAQSDWAELALLRTGFESDANSLLVDWGHTEVRLFLSALGCGVLAGDWTAEVSVNDRLVEFPGDWTCTCWFQDDDVAFAELERGSTGAIRHVRHVMLHLQDHFVVLADSVRATGSDDEVKLRSSVPVVSGVDHELDPVTREIIFKTEGPACRILPAWLPDDRIQSAAGECRVENEMLQSTAVGRGGVFQPLVMDWHHKNSRRDADWTTLTVTEERRILTSHDAAAVRTRIGRQQLMLFRSLKTGESLRAVLGHHTANETVYGKFTNEGDIEPLVLVEPTANN